MPASPPRLLHVTNGTSATDLIRDAGIPGLRSMWGEPLHEGPVPANVSDEELIAVRAAHLAGPEPGDRPRQRAIAGELKQWRGIIDDIAAYDELVLWYEHDLFDQLNLIQALTHIGRRVGDSRCVTLICINEYPGRPRFKGIGELTPKELAPLLGIRQPVTAAQYGLAARAWDAFRAADPRALEALLATDTTALPLLDAALRRHLEEFPASTDGLSRTERRLLGLMQDAPVGIRDAFPRMHDDETAFFIADGSFWTVVEELATAAAPLVTIDAPPSSAALPEGSIALTDFGREVLAGRADRVRQSGVDRWLGGVRLFGTGPTWRWAGARAGLVFA
jgi:hypothetical protein